MTTDCTCPIWGTPASISPSSRDGKEVNSARAGGAYFISGTAVELISYIDDAVKARLTTWLIDQRRLGVECPEVMSTTIEEVKRRQPLPILERADRLLGFLGTLSRFIGDEMRIKKPVDFWRFFAVSESNNEKEVEFLLEILLKREFIIQELPSVYDSRGLIDFDQDAAIEESGDYLDRIITILADGYIHLAELETKAIDSKQAFIAMWFDDSVSEVYERGIAKAILDAGYQPVRIDKKDHNNKIDDEIVAEIRRSRFLVADFTHGEAGMRGGVYYEAGFAHGLNIPVIFTCRQDVIDKVHFDIRQYNHITWRLDKIEEFRRALANRISATIGDGPLKGNE
ncbi:hypothetical protein H2509_06850 [Stappia sp. F7233]|uniref:Nucleoside 2-deoxyribosyltransferase n=1 Tax=Stappia albiluteola TaxID=2758565 RepID=A0A839ACK5_9HYPH|nr:hypothetical protein [Stappia albiluteola]MBA5776845.1 hypothetical protein [Stappia albiluteola]